MALGFERWLAELTAAAGDLDVLSPSERIARFVDVLAPTLRAHGGLARAFLASLAAAPHDAALRALLRQAYRESRTVVAALLGWDTEPHGELMATLAIAAFDGLLVQLVVDDEFDPSADELRAALDSFRRSAGRG